MWVSTQIVTSPSMVWSPTPLSALIPTGPNRFWLCNILRGFRNKEVQFMTVGLCHHHGMFVFLG